MATNYLILFCVLWFVLCTNTDANFTSTTSKRMERANIIGFQPLGGHVLLGLDLVVPFITVPVGKRTDETGNERALINIDTASLILSGLVTGGSLASGYLFRNLVMETKEAKKAGKRSDSDFNESILQPFRLVYTNATGDRVETSLQEVFSNFEAVLLEKDVDLAACLQKSICVTIYESGVTMRNGNATAIHKIVDGVVNLQWLMNMMRPTILIEAIDVGKVKTSGSCDLKYPQCKWSRPQVKLMQLLRTYVKFT